MGRELSGVQAAPAKAACVRARRGGGTYSSLQNAEWLPVGRERVWEASGLGSRFGPR